MPRWEFYHLRWFSEDASYSPRVAEPVRQALESVLESYLVYVRIKTCVGNGFNPHLNNE